MLRFSALSSAEVTRYPDIDDALRSIQEIRNSMVAHTNDEKINAADFQKTWEQLKQNLLAIGGSEEEIDATFTGMA